MKNVLLASMCLLAIPALVHAEDGDWSGSGELGFAATSGNTKSQNLNAKLAFKKEDMRWKHAFHLNALRSKGEISDEYELTANRYELGASSGYKFDERSYLVGAARYENDDFSPYEYQWVVSLGYGYTFIKNQRTELSAEIGPGFRRLDERPYTVTAGTPPVATIIDPDVQGNIVGRGLIAFKHKFNEVTAFENTLLIEAGSNNNYVQNEAGFAVSMNKKFALKLGYQIRHNSEVQSGQGKDRSDADEQSVYNF